MTHHLIDATARSTDGPTAGPDERPTDELLDHRYADTWRRSLDDRESFWLETAELIDWHRAPTRALDELAPTQWRWFPDGELNTCYNAVDRHVAAGHGERTAIIYDSAMTGTQARISYAELLDLVARFAGVLRDLGVGQGDRVVIYMPMIPEAAVAMLACARLGAIHSVVFGGFAPNELAVRIDDAEPKAIVTTSGGLEPNRTVEYLPIVEKALGLSTGSVETVIVADRALIPGSADEFAGRAGVEWVDWKRAEAATDPVDPVPVPANHPAYILYTSGTTGNPKGVVRDTGGHAVALARTMQMIYGIGPGDVFWTASDVGWVVGHSYIVYGPLLAGATTVIYEGKPVGTPDAATFWRVVEQYRVKALFTAPTAVRAIRREDPELDGAGKHDISSLEAVFLAGERLDPETYHWLVDGLHCPVIDHWWQTETGWPICANPRGLELLPRRRARRRCRARASICASSTARAATSPSRASRAPSRCGCRCLPATSSPSGAIPSASPARTSRSSPATTPPATRATSTRTATCS